MTIKTKNFNVISICETWLKPTHLDDFFKLNNYSFFRQDRPGKRVGGGVCMWIRNDLNPEKLTNSENEAFDYLICVLHKAKLLYILCYLPPNLTSDILETFRIEVTIKLDSFLIKYPFYEVVLVGDLNKHPMKFLNENYNLVNLVNKPTRKLETLDFIFVPEKFSHLYKEVEIGNPVAGSDHASIVLEPKVNTEGGGDYKVSTYYEANSRNIRSFKEKLAGMDWAMLYSIQDVDSKIRLFNSYIQNACDIIPKKMVIIKKEDPQWMTAEIKIKIGERWRAYKAKDFPTYERLKEQVKTIISIAKKNWANKIRNKENNIWKIVDSLTGKDTNTPNFPEDCAEFFAAKFHSIFSKESTYTNPGSTNCNMNDSSFLTSTINVHKYLKQLNSSKSIGPGDVPISLYKVAADIICLPLCNIINSSLETGIFPTEWKRSFIIPIPKTIPPNKEEVRPISLLPVLSKIMEKVMVSSCKKLFIQNYGIDQFGFREKSSTTCALVKLTNSITNYLDDIDSRNVVLISVDFSKAFDRVNHDCLLKKLLFLPKNCYNVIKSYLQNREFRVKIGSTLSASHKIPSSVPQGSVIGPILWCIYCADLQITTKNVECIKFADDTNFILKFSKKDTDIEDKIKQVMNQVQDWCRKNMVTLNTNKTKIMNITFSNSHWIPSTVLAQEFCFVNQIKLLGVIITSDLKWNTHIENVTRRCSQRLYCLRVLKSVLTRKELIEVFNSYIRPLYEYCCPLFTHLPHKIKTKILNIFNRAHFITCNGTCECPKDSISRLKSLSMSLFHKALGDNSHILHSIIPNKSNINPNRLILPARRTNRAINSFIMYCSITYNST